MNFLDFALDVDEAVLGLNPPGDSYFMSYITFFAEFNTVYYNFAIVKVLYDLETD